MAVTRYVYGGNGDLLSEDRAGIVKYYRFDGRGSTTAMFNQFGAVSDTFRFDSFGNAVERTGTTATPFRWHARATEWLLGLYWNSAGGTYSPKDGGNLNGSQREFWDNPDVFDAVDYARDECRQRCTFLVASGGRTVEVPATEDHPRHRTYIFDMKPALNWDCYNLCLADALWRKRLAVYQQWALRGKGDIRSCCTVTALNRPVMAGVYHPWIWLDKNCNGKREREEIYGYGPRDNYNPHPRTGKKGVCPREDWHATVSGEDWNSAEVYAIRLNCSCTCLAAWFESHFGWELGAEGNREGRPWCPDRYPLPLEQALYGARRNSIGFIVKALTACCPDEEAKLDCFSPEGGPMQKWKPRPGGDGGVRAP